MNLTPFRIHDRSPMFIPDALASDWLNVGMPDDAMGLLQAIELPTLHAEPIAGPLPPPNHASLPSHLGTDGQ